MVGQDFRRNLRHPLGVPGLVRALLGLPIPRMGPRFETLRDCRFYRTCCVIGRFAYRSIAKRPLPCIFGLSREIPEGTAKRISPGQTRQSLNLGKRQAHDKPMAGETRVGGGCNSVVKFTKAQEEKGYEEVF